MEPHTADCGYGYCKFQSFSCFLVKYRECRSEISSSPYLLIVISPDGRLENSLSSGPQVRGIDQLDVWSSINCISCVLSASVDSIKLLLRL